VLELCAGTLTQCFAKEYNGPKLPRDVIVLYKIANGLHYIHSQNLVHRDVKPDNILISMTTPVQMKLSDFGFVKKISPQGTFTQSGLKGTEKWMAPEILELLKLMEDDEITEYPRGSIQSDTFAAGCVFFYFLTRGKHPFGISFQIGGNILKNKPIELNKHNQSKYFTCICITIFTRSAQHFLITDLQGDVRALYELIGKMIKPIGQRILLPEVIEQLTAKLYASRKSKFFFELNIRIHYYFFNLTFALNGPGQFKKFERSMSGKKRCACRFHPTESVFACGVDDQVILLSADNSSIPFSNWKGKETQLKVGNFGRYEKIEWNVSRVFYIFEYIEQAYLNQP
jgi:serine/threonine protein kinase